MIQHLITAVVNGVIADSPAEMEEIINTYTLPLRWTVLTRGTKLVLVGDDQGGGGEIVLPEYQAVLDYATGQGFTLPSAQNQSEQNILMAALIDANVFNRSDVFYCFMTDGDSNFAKINWKAPGINNLAVSAGAPAFSANGGFTFTPADSFANGAVAAANWTVDDAGVFCDFDASNTVAGNVYLGPNGHTQHNFGTNISRVNFTAGLANITGQPKNGFYHVFNRTLDSTVRINRNGVQVSQAGHPANSLSIPATLGSNINMRAWCYGYGASLSELIATLYNVWTAYANPIKAAKAYADIIAYATSQAFTLPSAPQQAVQQQLVLDLIDSGIWDELDVFYNFYTDGDEDFAKINWKEPGTFQATNPGAAFTVMDGFKGTGVGGLQSSFTLFADAVKFQPENCSYFHEIAVPALPATDIFPLSGWSQVPRYYDRAPRQTASGWYDVTEFGGRGSNGAGGELPDDTPVFLHLKNASSTLCQLFRNGTLRYQSGSLPPAQPSTSGSLRFLSDPAVNVRTFVFGAGSGLNGREAALFNAWSTYKANA